MAEVMDKAIEEIEIIWKNARVGGDLSRPIWPMIILMTQKDGLVLKLLMVKK